MEAKPRKLTKSDIGKVFWIHGNKKNIGRLVDFDLDDDPMFEPIKIGGFLRINADKTIHCYNDYSHIEKTD